MINIYLLHLVGFLSSYHDVFSKTVFRGFLVGEKTARTIMDPSHPPTIVQNKFFWTLKEYIVPGVADTARFRGS